MYDRAFAAGQSATASGRNTVMTGVLGTGGEATLNLEVRLP